MAELKTQRTGASVRAFLDGIPNADRRRDCKAVLRLMQRVTGLKPEMWGTSMVGFGLYHYTYASGHSGEWFLVGFAPRKRDLTVYLMAGFDGLEPLLARLGKHKTGKSCLYIGELGDIDTAVLEKMIEACVIRLQHRRG